MKKEKNTKVPFRKRCIRARKVLRLIVTNIFRHALSKNAASLAYYLLFSIFPILIFLSNLLGLLDLNVYAITNTMAQILPKDIVSLTETYLDFISNDSSHTLLWFSLVFSIWFPLRAVQGLMVDVRRAYGLKFPKNFVFVLLKQFVYTVLFLGVIILTLLLTVFGENVLRFIFELFPQGLLPEAEKALSAWQYLRFIPVSFLMFLAIGSLYTIALDERPSLRSILPGTVMSLISWLGVSMAFSFYVENFAHYSFIYGTLGAVIVLIVWLFLMAEILILGAELNAAIEKVRREEEEEEAVVSPPES